MQKQISMKRKTSNASKKPIRRERREDSFSKYEGVGNPQIGSGIKKINRWLRDLRGK